MFVYDRGSDTFVLASVGTDDAPAKGTSSDPSLSADGRWVAFASFAPNLVPGDGNGTTDVFVIMPVEAINTRYFAHFGSPDELSAAVAPGFAFN